MVQSGLKPDSLFWEVGPQATGSEYLHEAKQYRKLPRPRDARQVNQWLIQQEERKTA